MIALVVMAIGSMGVMEMMKNQSIAARNIGMTVDKNAFKSALTGMLENPSNCQKVLGGVTSPRQFNNFDPPGNGVALKYKTLGALNGVDGTIVFAAANRPLPGNSKLNVGLIRVEELAVPSPPNASGVVKHQVQLVVPITKAQMANGDRNIAGDTFMPSAPIPLTLSIKNDGTLEGCSTANTGCDNNSIKTGDACRAVTCDPGKVPIGIYATEDLPHKVGDVKCGPLYSHAAGTLNGNPVACPRGSWLKNDGTCSAPGESKCGANEFETSHADDGSSTCCQRVYGEDCGSQCGDHTRASAQCAPGSFMSNVAGGCFAYGDDFMWLRTFDASGIKTGRGSMKTVRAEARCAGNGGTEVMADCCRFADSPPATIASDPGNCGPTGIWNGNGCVFDPTSCARQNPVQRLNTGGTACYVHPNCGTQAQDDGDGNCVPRNHGGPV